MEKILSCGKLSFAEALKEETRPGGKMVEYDILFSFV